MKSPAESPCNAVGVGDLPSIDLRLPSPVSELDDDRLTAHRVGVVLKRDDLIHPELPGNKWRKLKRNLAAARDQGHDTLLTFGGACSNHIRATAAAGHYGSFRTIGVVRGEEHVPLPPERRANYLLDLTASYAYGGNYQDAVRSLTEAERLAPQEVRCRPLAHGLLRALLSSTTGSLSRTAQSMATRAGVAA